MAALSEDGRYGLNCGRRSADRVTVLHVKLTETALKAIECHQKSTVSWAYTNIRFYIFFHFGYLILKKMTRRKESPGEADTAPLSWGKLNCHAQVGSYEVSRVVDRVFAARPPAVLK